MSYPQDPYGQQGGQSPYGGQPPYGAPPPYRAQPPYGAQPPGEQPYGVQPQYLQAPLGSPSPAGGPPAPPPMTEPPQTIVWARRSMWAGAALTMLYTPAAGVDMRLLHPGEWDSFAAGMSDSTAAGVFIILMVIGLAFSMLFAAIWVLIARGATRGQEWARIVGSTLFVLWLLVFCCGLLGPTLGFALVINTLLALVGLAATLFLWLPDSSKWFDQHKASRHPF